MNSREWEMLLAKQLEESHRLLQKNNLLLHKIMKQNELICEITQQKHTSFFLLLLLLGKQCSRKT